MTTVSIDISRATALALAANLCSALLFVVLVNEPVFDDAYSLRDALRYATEGIGARSLDSHVNAAGPGSYVWMAFPAWLLEPTLSVLRGGVLASWVLLAAGRSNLPILTRPVVLVSVLFLIFFLMEQVGVGGTMQFFERYVLQAAPFIGMLAFGLLPRLGAWRAGAMLAMLISSHWMLWRFA